MPRVKNIFVLLAFVLWILPLGVFIKSTDEKKVCGGQRAICLCSHVAKGQTGAAKTFSLAYPASTEKDNSSSNGSGLHFLAADLRDKNVLDNSKLSDYTPNLYSLIVCKSVEHVPKV